MPNSHNIDRVIGERVRIARTKKGFSQSDLARTINVTQSYLSRIETGDRSLSAQLCFAIAIALEINESEMNPYKNAVIWSPVTIPLSFQIQNK